MLLAHISLKAHGKILRSDSSLPERFTRVIRERESLEKAGASHRGVQRSPARRDRSPYGRTEVQTVIIQAMQPMRVWLRSGGR
jgi:hypothetical protein